MPEETQQAQETPVTETQEAPMPSAEQQTAEITAEAVSTQELPTDNERTKREFDKLRTQLREERQKRQYVETVFNQMQPAKPQPEISPIVDPETGYINEQALTDAQRLAQEAKREAEATRQQWQAYQQDQEDKQVFGVYPELNPDTKGFNKELHNLTSAMMLSSMVNPDEWGGQLSFMDAASKAKSILDKGTDAAKREGAQEALAQLTPKEQASLEVDGNSGRRAALQQDTTDLARRTRRGDLDAIVERMRRTQG